MADSKYAGLPGIVTDQPDVYETSDLPESEQAYSEPESGDSNPAFEVLHISGTEAFDKFKGKYVNSSDIDFSDRISKHPRRGYRANALEWNIGGEDEDCEETVVQKYQRLQCEINNLQQEVQQMEGTVKHGDGVVAVADLSQSVDELHGMLHSLKLEQTLGKEMFSAAAEPEHALQTKLVNLLEELKKTGIVSEKKTEGSKPSGELSVGGVTYELQYAPEHAKLSEMARASHLESKLDKLEALIGNDKDRLSSLSTWTNHKSLLGSVEVLSSRLALLEPSHLDHVEGRLHAVHTRMNAITEKKTAVEDANKQSKVGELYDLMKKCEVLTAALPEIVDRLTAVESLHQEATQFSRSLKQLDAAQAELTSKLDGNASLLTASQEKFLSNLTAIQSSMNALDQRIQKLQQKGK